MAAYGLSELSLQPQLTCEQFTSQLANPAQILPTSGKKVTLSTLFDREPPLILRNLQERRHLSGNSPYRLTCFNLDVDHGVRDARNGLGLAAFRPTAAQENGI
jgi:hypothetical protein